MKWASLTCKNAPEDIQLYYDFSSSAAGLLLVVSDLCSIWEVSLTREEVVQEAHAQNCSIDPSECSTQLRTLLNKLKQSLLEGQNDLGRDPNAVKHSFSIHTKLKLPAPLNLLKWTFHLQQQDSARLAHAVTFPLLREATLMKQHIQTLYQVIKDKDHVLSKVLDKIDSSAIDLSHIFPGITGMKSRKQRIDVSEASKHIPGMATFDRSSWEAGIAKSSHGNSSNSTDFSELLTGINTSTSNGFSATNWTRSLPTLEKHTSTGDPQDSEADDDTLDVRSSNPRRLAKAKAEDSGSATESDFEDLADTPRRKRQSKEQISSPESPSPWRAHVIKPLSSSPMSGDKSQSPPRKDKSAQRSSNSDSDRPVRKTDKKMGNKLGLIGGQRKASPARLSSPTRPASSNTSTPSRKLGVLGGQRASTKSPSKSPVTLRMLSETSAAPDEGTGSDTASSTSSPPLSNQRPTKAPVKDATSPPVKEKTPEPEETVEDKAKRKREELKRTQAHGAAKKKARRF
jgi:XLF-Cernunnos, XRcc4-like factor, NHEJ component